MPKIGVGPLALRYAVKEIGVTENPPNSNTGKDIRRYHLLAYGGAVIPGPWCADFVSAMLAKAGWIPTRAFNRRYVPSWAAAARSGWEGVLSSIGVASLQPGDLVCYDWGSDGTADHIGIFEAWTSRKDGTFTAIEGNTSSGNDSNGGKVMRRNRNIRQVQAAIRVNLVVDDPVAPAKPKLTLEQRLAKAGFGPKSVAAILRLLRKKSQ